MGSTRSTANPTTTHYTACFRVLLYCRVYMNQALLLLVLLLLMLSSSTDVLFLHFFIQCNDQRKNVAVKVFE